jgi:hypothetical protein
VPRISAKLVCENDFLKVRGESRCRQSVSRLIVDLKSSKAALLSTSDLDVCAAAGIDALAKFRTFNPAPILRGPETQSARG